ncbi:hypothetical protein DVY91_12030 [Enterococcus faecalis]|uniref:hypothetical protein n=1 Tax=Enterococcus faecalis TaxID=1351 RepID=UPI0009AC5FB5|nr:hypothetical protein [Enterococcus faecalis]AUC59108.1 hypothetical protein CG806_12365 [Enterococcus faecalis ARO1/DG]EKI7569048.1 hypothetical protein [Enterococcus faecalis]MBD9808916.1 hypothetical protein [Enterococcus faecalis]TKM49320.1 hypothetical protein DVW59_12700 [Enterococcus faecalis]TKM58342.1 hypothetical protein DVW57_11840 [Enterococcus faecalis]
MIPKIEVWMHDMSVGYPVWFEVDSIDYLENSFVIVDEFGNPHEFSGEGRLFRVKTEEEKHMKFYEIKEPYFALIAAKDEKQCLKLYKDIVCEVEDEKEFFDDMKTIDKYEAFKMLAKSRIEDGGELGAEEAFNQLENLEENGEVLLIDGGLI